MDPDEEVRQILARAEELLVLGKVLDALEQVPHRSVIHGLHAISYIVWQMHL